MMIKLESRIRPAHSDDLHDSSVSLPNHRQSLGVHPDPGRPQEERDRLAVVLYNLVKKYPENNSDTTVREEGLVLEARDSLLSRRED